MQELKQTQNQLIQTEKIASLGQLVAGIDREINNPVNFIQGNISHINYYPADLLQLVKLDEAALPNTPKTIVQPNKLIGNLFQTIFKKFGNGWMWGVNELKKLLIIYEFFLAWVKVKESGYSRWKVVWWFGNIASTIGRAITP